ncbi:MAG: galactosyldiacylglycerol synthase [Candidatus Binataceae bacterium]
MSAAGALAESAHKQRVDLIFFDAGGGHRASAMALKAVADQQGRSWETRAVNLRDLIGPLDFVNNNIGVRFEDLYNGLLKRGLTVGTGAMLRVCQLIIRHKHAQGVAMLKLHWLVSAPDVVVSMIPNFNRAIFDGLRAADRAAGRPPTPMVTVLTDLADCPPHFWMERQEQYFICGTARAAQQALDLGHSPQRIFRTSGMIVRPEFYQPLRFSREYERRRLGLRGDLPTGLVMFGGFGSRQMLAIARRIARARLKTQLIFLCGHNQTLKEQLAAMRLPYPHRVEGFTREIRYFMGLADYFVGKPGPGSLSEALLAGLPVVVERNTWTMVQERYNTEWIREERLGIVLQSFREIAGGIAPMLDPEQLAGLRARVAAVNNRAVFEIPDIVATLIPSPRDAACVRASIPQPEISIGPTPFPSFSRARSAG